MIGVNNGELWFHEDGDPGASYYGELKTREEFERKGVKKAGVTTHVTSLLSDSSDSDSDESDDEIVSYKARSGDMYRFNISNTALRKWGLVHGQRLKVSCAKLEPLMSGATILHSLAFENTTATKWPRRNGNRCLQTNIVGSL